MPRAVIDREEWWPVYSTRTDLYAYDEGKTVEVSDALIAREAAVLEEFEVVQGILQRVRNGGPETPPTEEK